MQVVSMPVLEFQLSAPDGSTEILDGQDEKLRGDMA
jgi:hypothetical protein